MERDFGAEAQAAAEARLETIYSHEEEDSPVEFSFCGCETCLVREVLTAAWPFAEAYCDDALAAHRDVLSRLLAAVATKDTDAITASAQEAEIFLSLTTA